MDKHARQRVLAKSVALELSAIHQARMLAIGKGDADTALMVRGSIDDLEKIIAELRTIERALTVIPPLATTGNGEYANHITE